MVRPVVNFVDSSSVLSSKLFENIAVSISFISINGYSASQISSSTIRRKMVSEQESSGINLIGKLCNKSFKHTVSLIANDE